MINYDNFIKESEKRMNKNNLIIAMGGRFPNKMTNQIFELMQFSKEKPNENTLFVGKTIVKNIESVMKRFGFKWHIYIEMDYDKLERECFVGKFRYNKIKGEIENE